jgi:hypothetical protein
MIDTTWQIHGASATDSDDRIWMPVRKRLDALGEFIDVLRLGLRPDVDEDHEVVGTQREFLEKGTLLMDAVDQKHDRRTGVGALFGENVAQLIDAATSVDQLRDQTQISIHATAFALYKRLPKWKPFCHDLFKLDRLFRGVDLDQHFPGHSDPDSVPPFHGAQHLELLDLFEPARRQRAEQLEE